MTAFDDFRSHNERLVSLLLGPERVRQGEKFARTLLGLLNRQSEFDARQRLLQSFDPVDSEKCGPLDAVDVGLVQPRPLAGPGEVGVGAVENGLCQDPDNFGNIEDRRYRLFGHFGVSAFYSGFVVPRGAMIQQLSPVVNGSAGTDAAGAPPAPAACETSEAA